MRGETRYIEFMGAYWSLPFDKFRRLMDLVRENQPFDLYQLGARELRSKPRGKVIQIKDTEPRREP